MNIQWPPERRAAAQALILQRKPWKKSTGPKTAAGKARVGKNAIKRGLQSREARTLRQTLEELLAQGQATIGEAEE